MPRVKKDESKQDFLKRCTKQLIDNEGRKPKEAYAVCNSLWDKSKGEASLTLSAPIDMTLEAKENERRTFLITAKTKEPLKVWGETIFIDIEGVQTAEKLPVLREHDRRAIVGYGAAFKEDSTLYIEGEFSKNTRDGREVLALADEGYPWQASIGIWFDKMEVLEDEKSKAEVNGRTVKGPAVIMRESRVREVSFVTLGADDKTAAIALSDECCGEDINTKQEVKKKMNLEELKKEHPELIEKAENAAYSRGYDDGRKDGEESERMRVVEILEADADGEMTLTAIKEGTPAHEAYKAFYMAEKKRKEDGLNQLEAQAPKPVGTETPSEPETPKPGDVEAKLKARASEIVKEKSCTLEAAFSQALRENPKAAEEYLKTFQAPVR